MFSTLITSELNPQGWDPAQRLLECLGILNGDLHSLGKILLMQVMAPGWMRLLW
jgi:hypothetical protein